MNDNNLISSQEMLDELIHEARFDHLLLLDSVWPIFLQLPVKINP